MRNLVLGAMTLAFASLAPALVNPGWADAGYPYCAMATSVCAESCDFSTLAQCRAFIAGDKGYCAPNPRLASAANAALYTPRPRR